MSAVSGNEASRSALWRWLPGLGLSSRTGYILRTLLAMAIALHIAFWLQLGSPGSAAVTVMIVANPTRGAILSKGFWRVFGTLTGALAGIAIMTFFPQSTFLFLVALALWLGLCTFISSMFRYFRSYGAVLSGYTVTLVAFGALNDPNMILATALNRLSVVTLGVIVSTVVTMIFQPTLSRQGLRGRLIGNIARVAALVRDDRDIDSVRAAREQLIVTLAQIDEAIEYSGVETPDVRRHANSLRGGLVALSGTPFALLHIGRILRELTSNPLALPPGLGALAMETQALMVDLSAAPNADKPSFARLSARVSDLTARMRAEETVIEDLLLAGQAARLHGFLGRLEEAVAPIAAWDAGGAPYHRRLRLGLFRDYRSATRNAVRSALAIMLGGSFWYLTAWPAGSQLLAVLGPVCALMAALPSAAAASLDFFKGIVIATFAAFICLFFFLPSLSDFPMLFLAMLPFLVVGVYFTTIPRHGIVALGFVVFFITQLGLANTMTFDAVTFLNSAMVFILGAVASVLVFRVLLPPTPAADARQLARLMRRALERVGPGIGQWQWLEWQNLQHQRLLRMLMRLQAFRTQRVAAVEAGGPLLIISRDIFRLHIMLRDCAMTPETRAVVTDAFRSFRDLRPQSRAAEAAAHAAAWLEESYRRGGDTDPVLLQAAAAFRAISRMLPEAEPILGLEQHAFQGA